jgi:DNA-binding beta-propeller fold protein YncE
VAGAGPSLVIRFGAGRITLAHDDDTVSGLPTVAHRDTTAGAATPPAELAALLAEVLRDAGPPVPSRLTVIHPIGWDDGHRIAMTRAAAAAGVSAPRFLTGPLAVAHAVATGVRRRRAAAVVTLGGPLAEVAVLIRTRTGFTVLGEPSGVLVPHTPEGRGRVVGELLTAVAGAGLTAEQLAGVYVVGDTEPGAPLAAEIQKKLGVATSARRELETAAIDGALTAYPRKRRGIRRRTLVAAGSVLALIVAVVGGLQLRGGAEPAGARFVAATPAAAPAPLVHLLNADAGTLATLNTATGTTSEASPVPAGEADWFRLAPDGRTAVIGNVDGITLVDTVTRRVGHHVPLPGATGSVFTADGRTLHVLTGQGRQSTVVPVDVATGATGRPIPAGQAAGPMVKGPDGVLYVLEPGRKKVGGRLDVIDPVAGTSRPVPMPPNTREIAPAPDGSRLFLAAGRKLVPFRTTVGIPVEMPGKILALTVAPDSRTLYVLCTGRVFAVDAATAQITAEIPLPGVGNAWRLSVSPDSRRVYVYGSTDVPVIGWIDATTNRAGPPIPVGEQPWEILHRADSSAAYVLAQADETRSSLVTVDAATGAAGRAFTLPPGPVVPATP